MLLVGHFKSARGEDEKKFFPKKPKFCVRAHLSVFANANLFFNVLSKYSSKKILLKNITQNNSAFLIKSLSLISVQDLFPLPNPKAKTTNANQNYRRRRRFHMMKKRKTRG
jgi:hypothetical protein